MSIGSGTTVAECNPSPTSRDRVVQVLSGSLIAIRADALAQLKSGLSENQRKALIGMIQQIDAALAHMDDVPALEPVNGHP